MLCRACGYQQALTESSELEALRREKRAIIDEERCLKALMDIEKSSGHRKAQMLAALRAEKQRHAAKAEYRRKSFAEALHDHLERETHALREKHDLTAKHSRRPAGGIPFDDRPESREHHRPYA